MTIIPVIGWLFSNVEPFICNSEQTMGNVSKVVGIILIIPTMDYFKSIFILIF